jgi:hypothetical protein
MEAELFAVAGLERSLEAWEDSSPRVGETAIKSKLKITVWGINYAPELTGIAPFNAALCNYLVKRGHECRNGDIVFLLSRVAKVVC